MPQFDEDTGVIMALKAIEQSIASGRMSIDEMHPVQEFLPAIMAAIRDESGLTKGDLRRLAEGPGIPSRVILNALMAVQHQQPRESPEMSVAWAQCSYELARAAREDGRERMQQMLAGVAAFQRALRAGYPTAEEAEQAVRKLRQLLNGGHHPG